MGIPPPKNSGICEAQDEDGTFFCEEIGEFPVRIKSRDGDTYGYLCLRHTAHAMLLISGIPFTEDDIEQLSTRIRCWETTVLPRQ